MKTTLSFLLFWFFYLSVHTLFAQSSKGFNYQAIARDNAGAILENTLINLRFQIRETTPIGTLIFQEKHTPTTNAFGLVQVQIGKGTVESGDFSTISWGEDDHYLIVELNGAGVDTSHFEAVPYAKVATAMQMEDLQDVARTTPTTDQVLRWNGSEWAPATLPPGTVYTAGVGININGTTIENTAPDQTVSISGAGATSISGSYPNFTISSTDNVNDADASTTNEIQAMSLSGNTLSLSLGGGSVNLASFSSPWNNSGSNLYFSTGKVGIGDNSPVATLTVGNGDKFQVHGSDGDIVLKDDQGSLRFANSNGSNSPMIHMFQSGTNNSTRMLVAHSPNFSSWGIQYNDTADAFNWIGDNQPIFQVQLSGQQRLGVGTFSPSSRFHIVHESNTSDAHIELTEDQFDYSRIKMNNTIHNNFWDIAARTDTNLNNAQFNIYHSDAGDIFTVRGTKRVGINDATPSYPLDIVGNGESRVIDVSNTLPSSPSSFNYGVRSSLAQATTASSPRLYALYGSATDGDSYQSYGVYGYAHSASNFNYGVFGRTLSSSTGYAGYFSGSVYTTGSYLPSDAALKSNLKPLETGLATILALRPQSYQFKTKEYDFMTLPEGEQYGFLAQDLKALIPSLTKESLHPYDEQEHERYGKEGVRFTAVNYTGLIPIMVSGIQEQQSIIEAQEQKIQSLEQRLAKLEQLINQ